MVTVYAVHTQCRLGLCVQKWPLFSVQPNRTSTLTTVKLNIPKYFSCDCDDQIIIIQYWLLMKNSRKSNRTMQSILSFGRNCHDRFCFSQIPKHTCARVLKQMEALLQARGVMQYFIELFSSSCSFISTFVSGYVRC